MIRTPFSRAFIIAFTYVLLSTAPLVAQSHDAYRHGFEDAEGWAEAFDNPERDAWQKPHEVIRKLALKPDKVIADIGSGTGYFTVRLARMVPKGRVYGVDVEPAMVRYLAERAKRERLKNIVSLKGKPDDPLLPEKVDRILMVDVFHHIEDRIGYFRRLQDTLKPGGRIAIIDYRIESPEGPPKSMRVPPQDIKAELNSAGYTLLDEYDFLPKQYFLIFQQATK